MQNTFEGPYSNFCNSQIENGKAITMRELKKNIWEFYISSWFFMAYLTSLYKLHRLFSVKYDDRIW